ncbi:MAG: TolC family protein [Defluviitaleaceae bacterium]|nr:TolC family protein [Defluviitaleaceae bacterium]
MIVFASATREIPYDQALSGAISRDASVTSINRDIRSIRSQARTTERAYLDIINTNRPKSEELQGRWKSLTAERDRLERERDRMLLSLELSLRNRLANIAGIEVDLEIMGQRLALQEQSFEQTRLRNQHGMASDVDLREAEHDLEQARLTLETLTLTLQNEHQSLNSLVNHPITANIQIIYDIHDFEPLPDESELERFIQRQKAMDHNLLNWQDQVAIRHYEWQRQLDDPAVDNQYMRLQHQIAVMERNMAERQAELSVRNALAEWDRLIEQQVALEADLTQAIADYENMQNRLEAGLVTQILVDQMALAVAASEARLAQHDYAFWIARLRIDHPYVR